MKMLRLTGIFMVFLVMLGCFSSCSEDNEESAGNVPSQLLKTWYMDDGSSVTFHADGTGIYTDPNEESTGGKLMRRSATRGAYTLPFTYSYEEEDNSIFIHTENEMLQLFIVTLTDDKLIVKNEDDNVFSLVNDLEAEVDIELLYHKKWLTEEKALYIFTENGEGSYKGKNDEEGMSLTYEYTEELRKLTIRTGGKKFSWSIISLTDDTLMVKDGNEQILVLEAVEGGGGSHPGGDVLYYLTGQWGVCGKPLFEFKSTDEGDFLTIHDGEGTYTLKYKYDSQNGQIYLSEFEDEKWGEYYMYWKVLECTNDYLKMIDEDGEFVGGFRIPEPNELVVGDEMLLYDKEWKTFDSDGEEMTYMFRRNFSDVVVTGGGERATLDFIYDEKSHYLTIIYGDGEENDVFEITKLTEKVLYLEPRSENADYIECRR